MMGTGFVVGMAIKIVCISVVGISSAGFMKFFSNYEFKMGDKGGRNNGEGEPLRQKASRLR